MDLKTALKDILPHITLRAPRRSGEKWPIDRPIEFHICACGQTIDQRILDICIYTPSDDQVIDNHRQFGNWCKLHDAPEIIALCSSAKPCKRCYRWTITKAKGGICWTCRHNPWCTMPIPMIAKRKWFRAPKEHVEVEVEDE